MKAEASFSLPAAARPAFSLQFSGQPLEMWGLNFAGSVRVSHKTGEERLIYLPGTRTYDPAGITGRSIAWLEPLSVSSLCSHVLCIHVSVCRRSSCQ